MADDVAAKIAEIAEGHPGAVEVLAQLVMEEKRDALQVLASLGVRGQAVWDVFVMSGRDLGQMCEVLARLGPA